MAEENDLAMIAEELLAGVKQPTGLPDFHEFMEGALQMVHVTHPVTERTLFPTHSFNRMCAWEEILCAWHGVVRTDPALPLQNRWYFMLGQAYHWMFQNAVFAHGGSRVRGVDPRGPVYEIEKEDKGFLGWWRCCECGHVTSGDRGGIWGWIPRPRSCSKCKGEAFAFEEPVSVKGDFMAHADGGYRVKGRLWHVEFKSSSGFAFKKCGMLYTNRDHLAQVLLNQYAHGAERSLLVLINKEEPVVKRAIKTYEVVYDPVRVEPLLRKAAVIKAAVSEAGWGRSLPEGSHCEECEVGDSVRVSRCAVKRWCPKAGGNAFDGVRPFGAGIGDSRH